MNATISALDIRDTLLGAAALFTGHGLCHGGYAHDTHNGHDDLSLAGAVQYVTHDGATIAELGFDALCVDNPANCLCRAALEVLRQAGFAQYRCDDVTGVNDRYLRSPADAAALLVDAAVLAERAGLAVA